MKYIKINKIQPQFTTVLTTLDTYEDDLIVNGIVQCPKGTIKMEQRVIAVGPNVREIKEGDLVLLDFTNYIVKKFRENSVKEDMEQMEDIPILAVPKLLIGDKLVGKFNDRDIHGVILEYEELESEKPKKKLI